MLAIRFALVFLVYTTHGFSADRSSLDYFRLSIEEIQKGFRYEEYISSNQGPVASISIDDVNILIKHAKKSLEYSELVKNDDLDLMDPSLIFKSLSKNYENLFREGLRLYIEAWTDGDPKKGLKANQLLDDWGTYYKKIRRKL